MKRTELVSKLEDQMLQIGKGIHEEQLHFDGCSPAQNHVLMVVAMTDSVGVKQLAELLHITPGAVTQHIDALVTAGYVQRETPDNDRRGVLVRLTAAGNHAYHEFRSRKLKLLTGLFADLSEPELETLVSLIEKVAFKFQKQKEGVA